MDDLECFANWQDARYNYFAAKIINDPEMDETKKYRCFVRKKLKVNHKLESDRKLVFCFKVYDRISPSGVIGQSADSSCRALDSVKIVFSNGENE